MALAGQSDDRQISRARDRAQAAAEVQACCAVLEIKHDAGNLRGLPIEGHCVELLPGRLAIGSVHRVASAKGETELRLSYQQHARWRPHHLSSAPVGAGCDLTS